jgi:hypothetical protein
MRQELDREAERFELRGHSAGVSADHETDIEATSVDAHQDVQEDSFGSAGSEIQRMRNEMDRFHLISPRPRGGLVEGKGWSARFFPRVGSGEAPALLDLSSYHYGS